MPCCLARLDLIVDGGWVCLEIYLTFQQLINESGQLFSCDYYWNREWSLWNCIPGTEWIADTSPNQHSTYSRLCRRNLTRSLKHNAHHTSHLLWRKKLEHGLSLSRCHLTSMHHTSLPSPVSRSTWATWAASSNRHACAVDEPEYEKMAENKVRKIQGSPAEFDSGTFTVGMSWCCGVVDEVPPPRGASKRE